MCDKQLQICFETLAQFREENELSPEHAFLFGLLVGAKVNRGRNFVNNALNEAFFLQTQEIEEGLTDQEIHKARVALFKKYNSQAALNQGAAGNGSVLGKRTAYDRQPVQLVNNGSLDDNLQEIQQPPEKKAKIQSQVVQVPVEKDNNDLLNQPTQLILGEALEFKDSKDSGMLIDEQSTDAVSAERGQQQKAKQEEEPIQIDTVNFWRMDDIKESNLKAPSFNSISVDHEASNSKGGNENDADSSNKDPQEDNLKSFFEQLQQQIDGGDFVDPAKAAEDERLTLELIEKIQKEEEEALEKLRKQNEEAQNNEFVCKICYEQYEEEHKIIPLMLCEHIFHQECMEQYLKTQIDESKFPINCPIPECKQEICDIDLKDILPEDLYKKFNDFTLNQAVQQQADMSWCPTADCKYAYSLPEGQTQLNCPLCSTHYCLKCKVVYHEGKTCAQYQAENDNSKDDDFVKFAQGKKFKQCPKCNFWVERSMGCPHMTCRCGQSFCYDCGGVYGHCECVLRRQEEHRQWMERQREARRERNRRARQARAQAAKQKKELEAKAAKKKKEEEKLKELAKVKQAAKTKLQKAPTHNRSTRAATMAAGLKEEKKKEKAPAGRRGKSQKK